MQTTNLDQQNIYTVSRLNNEIRFLLEDTYSLIWVEGEISNFAAPQSGHWYFSLKDATAQVRCALFKGNQRGCQFIPKDGLHVLIKARASLYPNRGEYQLIAEYMEERGEGKLRRAYELLKKKLELAGFFDVKHKKTLPDFPKQIGVITSATGAAIHDILTVLKRRFTSLPVIIYPTLVQGELAPLAIVKAIQLANKRNECDVLILARGGGSLEDLWPFNEESVAYAIYDSHIPIVSGVGHEVDFTIADFVADKRAPTPSAAAEMVTPEQSKLLQILFQQREQILKCLRMKFNNAKQLIIWTQKHLYQQHPKRRLTEKMQKLDFYESHLVQLQTRFLIHYKNQINELNGKLQQLTPLHRIHHLQHRTTFYHQRLKTLMINALTKQKTKLSTAGTTLNTLSPLATLNRGYAIAMTKDDQIIFSGKQVKPGEEIKVRMTQSLIYCRVEKTKEI